MTEKDELLELYNVEDYSKIKSVVSSSDIKEKEELLRIVSEVEIVNNDIFSYDGLIACYGINDTRNKMLEIKISKSFTKSKVTLAISLDVST